MRKINEAMLKAIEERRDLVYGNTEVAGYIREFPLQKEFKVDINL